MEKQTKTYFVVEIGGANFYFEKLQEATDLFAKMVETKAIDIGRIGYGEAAYYYIDSGHKPEMRQITFEIYQSREAAEFAKHNAENGSDE